MRKKILLLILVLFAVQNVAALSSIGTAPGYRDLGTIDRGESRQVTFYIVSDATQTFEVQANYREPLFSRVFSDGSQIKSEYSRQPIQDWIGFDQSSYVVDPNDTTTRTLESRAPVSSQGSVTFTINVPQNAEPGYRAGGVGLSPTSLESEGAFGSKNIVIARPTFSFRVPGDVQRDIDLVDLRGVRIDDNAAQIVAEFRNTGTVTTLMDGGSIPILNEANQQVGSVNIGQEAIKPGEYAQTQATWRGEDVDGGEYHLEGTVNYMTGNAYVGEQAASFVLTDQIQDRIQVQDTEPAQQGSGSGGPSMFLVIIFLVLLGVVLYSFDIDPFWVVITVCVLGVISLVLMTGIPNWSILILLIAVGGMVYYV